MGVIKQIQLEKWRRFLGGGTERQWKGPARTEELGPDTEGH